MSNQPATTVLPARDLKAGHMLVAPDGTLTEVTTDARPYAGGTRVRMVHDGFRSPKNDASYEGMNAGWNTILPRISQLAAELA